MKKLIMLLALTLVLTACGKKEEKDEVIVNPIETSTAPSYEEETEETEKETIEEETEEIKETETKETEKETEKSKDHQSKPAPKETEATKPAYKKVNDVKYAKSNVNVRSGPGASYKKLGSLTAGQKVTRTGVADNGWGVIDFSGKEGYVSGNYLVDTKPAAQTAEKPKETKPAETKPKDTNTDDKPNSERVPKKSPDYKPIPKGWIHSEELFGPKATPEQKKQISSWVDTWLKGGFTDKQLEDKLYSYMWETKTPDEEIDFILVHVAGGDKVPFISKKTPGNREHSANTDNEIYSYCGVYSTGELYTESDGDFTLFYEWSVFIHKYVIEYRESLE